MNCFYKRISQMRSLYTNCALLKETPRNLKGKKHSSQLWLTRQIRDPYVEMAKRENYRCRSAFKLLEINERFKILSPGLIVIECGAAPGSWTQVATRLTNSHARNQEPVGKVYAIDKLPFYPVEGATVLGNMDFTNVKTHETLHKLLQGNKADVILSDMAPNASGIREIDHDNIILLAYTALKFALQVTKVHGTLLIKVWDGRESQEFERNLLKFYNSVKVVRPNATRDESSEKFFLARGFKGLKDS